jgi:hypothetical protein
MSADDLQKQIDQLKKEKEKLDAERALNDAKSQDAEKISKLVAQKALVEAEKGLAEAQKALTQAQSGPPKEVLDLQNQKALVDAQKAADSQTQAALSKLIGDVKAGPFSGSVDLKDKAGTEEAALLAARVVREAAVRIAKAVCEKEKKKHSMFSRARNSRPSSACSALSFART